ncbi:transposable element Tcb1 transposase [Trichonephila clavipes]|nr:transposable element Tcb1 transposase [Trichonephila clavipes]
MANNQSVRRHMDAFTRGRIIGKLEEGRSVTSVAADFRDNLNFEETGGRRLAREIARHTTQATGLTDISRFTVARRLHGGGLFARRPVRCVPLTPAHRRRRSLWCREHRNWRDNEWGRVLFTDESRFSLSSDSHRILIWRERGSRNHPSNITERTGMEVAVFSFGEASCLVVVQTFTSSTQAITHGITFSFERSRIAIACQLIHGYSSRKRKGRPSSFQANTCVVPDDVRLASVGNHMPKTVSNYRRCRKCSRKGQEKRTRYMCAECDVSLCIATCFLFFMANNHNKI